MAKKQDPVNPKPVIKLPLTKLNERTRSINDRISGDHSATGRNAKVPGEKVVKPTEIRDKHEE